MNAHTVRKELIQAINSEDSCAFEKICEDYKHYDEVLGSDIMCELIKKDRIIWIKKLHSQYPYLLEKYWQKAMQIAILNDNYEVMKYIKSYVKTFNAADAVECLSIAVTTNHVESTLILLKWGISPDASLWNDRYALIIKRGYVEMLQLLIKRQILEKKFVVNQLINLIVSSISRKKTTEYTNIQKWITAWFEICSKN